MKARFDYQTKIVESGPEEPNAADLASKQADIFERLSKITPDQLAEFRSRSIDSGRSDEIKNMWEKTVWEK